MERKNKTYVSLRLATCLRKIISDNKAMHNRNKEKGIEDLSLIYSGRQLEAASGLSSNIIQGVMAGKRDLQFTTLLTLIESLGISLSKFATLYDKITDADIRDAIKQMEATRKSYARVQVRKKNTGGGRKRGSGK